MEVRAGDSLEAKCDVACFELVEAPVCVVFGLENELRVDSSPVLGHTHPVEATKVGQPTHFVSDCSYVIGSLFLGHGFELCNLVLIDDDVVTLHEYQRDCFYLRDCGPEPEKQLIE